MAYLVRQPIDVAALIAGVSAPGRGAISLFLGTVREVNMGRSVTGIDYSAYEPMAERELARIHATVVEAHPGIALTFEHRLGTLAVGEVSVAIAAAHAHRVPALEAVKVALEAIKVRVPIWKREHHADGSRSWVAAGGETLAPLPS